MAGLRGNQAWFMATKQTVKGTPQAVVAAATYKMPLTGGNIGPVREVDNLAETDSARDQGIAYVVSSGVEGSPEFYARGGSLGFWLQKVLGSSTAPVGAGADKTHTFTPTNTLPYITGWKMLGDTLWERYVDCKVGSLSLAAEAGQPLVITAGIQGASTTRLTSDPSTSPAVALDGSGVATLDNTPYSYNDLGGALGQVTLGGGATALVRSFELTIENNVTRQQTDGVEPYDVVEGQREVSLGFDLIFETLDEYNKFHYGGAAGTAISPTVFTTSANFLFAKAAVNSVAFDLPSIAYEEFSPEPDASGDPVVVSVRAVAQRNAGSIITATLKNQVATTY